MRGASLLLLCAVATACIDPVHNDAVNGLGDEPNGSHPGPTHRPGQPCMVCHGGHGPGSPEFAVAGTVFAVRAGTAPIAGVSINLKDATGATQTLSSNEVGNFYITKAAWAPAYPVSVTVSLGSEHSDMTTTIGRTGSCAECHLGAGDSSHMPAVYLRLQ